MIGRVLGYEAAGLRRSPAVPITLLFAVGGAVFGRTVTWVRSFLESSAIEDLLPFETTGTDVAVPLTLLALVIAAAYVFGRDLADGTADVLLTAPVSRDSVVVAKLVIVFAWTLGLASVAAGADAALRAGLALTAVDPGDPVPFARTLSAAIAAFAALPLIGWVALRFRGVVAPVGAGVAVYVAAMTLRTFEIGAWPPWNAPYGLILGEWDSVTLAGAVSVFLLGIAACFWEIRRVDLV